MNCVSCPYLPSDYSLLKLSYEAKLSYFILLYMLSIRLNNSEIIKLRLHTMASQSFLIEELQSATCGHDMLFASSKTKCSEKNEACSALIHLYYTTFFSVRNAREAPELASTNLD